MKKILLFVLVIFCISCGNRSENSSLNQETGIPEIDNLQQKIIQNPNNPELYVHLSNAYLVNKGYDEAIQLMEKAISFDTTQARYHIYLADIYMLYSKSYDALTTLQSASAQFPDSVEVWYQLGLRQNQLRQYPASIQTLNRIIDKNLANDRVYHRLGLSHAYLGESEKAIASWQRAVELNADNLLAYQDLAITCDTIGKDKMALIYFDNALAIDSTNIYTIFAKANFHTQRRQDNLAIEWYKKAIKYNKDYAEAYFNIGLIYMEYDSLNQAKRHFNMTVEVEPTHAYGYYYRGLAAEKLGDKKGAIADYKQALNINPDLKRAESALLSLEN